MKNKNIGPRKITRSLLEEKPRKKKKKDKTEDLFLVDAKPKRKKREVEDAAPEKKKKKKVASRELVVVNPKTDLSATDQKEIKSYFGSNSGKILDMLSVGDADSGLSLLKKTLLITVIRILPKAEEILNDSGTARGTYQFVTLVSQIRELITDIQSDRDRKYIAQSVMETIVRPSFMDIAQDMITKHHEFRKATERYLKQEHAQAFSADLRDLAKDLASGMNERYKEINTKITEALKN